MAVPYLRVAHLKSVQALRAHLRDLRIQLPVDPQILTAKQQSPPAQPIAVGGPAVGNRWCIHPMEGWDATTDGRPTDHTLRRWRHFGISGAKLIWGGEAFAVQHDGRANPHQLCYRAENESAMRDLLQQLTRAHRDHVGATDDLLVGLQLTHSGRFSRPNDHDKLEPRIAYHHPVLDRRVGIQPDDDAPLLSDDQIKRIIDQFIVAAKMAQCIGFQFVDIKHCHGYLGHEFLSAFDRPGPYGGDLIGRTRFLREIVEGIRSACPGLMIGVRLSVFDCPAHHRGEDGRGTADPYPTPYPIFGCRCDDPLTIDLAEPIELLKMMRDDLGVELVNLTAGSPYYCPHIQRPALYPPSDGYDSPQDPLVDCARQIDVVRQLKQAVPGLPMVGTGYTYFQEYLPHVAQAVVRDGWVDFVGVGRMVLSYPQLPADCLEAGQLRQAKKICRTFSDCTTAPRNGLISGCYPLDDHYKRSPQQPKLKAAKQATRAR